MAKVMVVDDAAFMRMMLKMLLVEAGHEVIAEATNGREAVHTYMKYKPDLVTMDVTMPRWMESGLYDKFVSSIH